MMNGQMEQHNCDDPFLFEIHARLHVRQHTHTSSRCGNKRKSVLNLHNFAKQYCMYFDSQITDENASKATNAVGITDTTP
jgi:hypothetical protein